MLEDKKILCGASQYEQLFYFNPEFDSLPKRDWERTEDQADSAGETGIAGES